MNPTKYDGHWLLQTYMIYSGRATERLERTKRIDDVLRGHWNLVDNNGDDLEKSSTNFILTAMEDTADAAATIPTMRVRPRKANTTGKRVASKMELIATGYGDDNQLDALIPLLIMDTLRTGLGVMVAQPSYDNRTVEWVRQDPNTCFPEPKMNPLGFPRRVIFAKDLYVSELPDQWVEKVKQTVIDNAVMLNETWMQRLKLTYVEYLDEKVKVSGAIIAVGQTGQTTQYPVIFEEIPNRIGINPAITFERVTWDAQQRGQYDQVIPTMLSWARLNAMLLDYADQSVYSDIWARDVIGEIPMGGGAFIELGPAGQIGRIPPAVSSLNVGNDLEMLLEQMHMSSRWPKTRPGQVDQAIASGKFVEATVGMMNTLIKTLHQIVARGLQHAVHVSFAIDQKYFPGEKVTSGIRMNQQFTEEYDPSKDIDLSNKVSVEYGLGLGRDPSQSAILMLGYKEQDLVSDEFVQENIDGLSDVGRERMRIDLQDFVKMLKAQILNGVQQGAIPATVLPDIIEARERGEDLVAIYRKYVAPPDQQAPGAAGQNPLAAMLGGGGPPGAGAPPGPGGAPPGPPGAGLPPGVSGPPPPPPDAGALFGRMQVPIQGEGPRNYISSQVGG